MWRIITVACLLICFIDCKSMPENNTAVLISKYAKVAHWGANENNTKPDVQEGRSSNGQTVWTHRSDVNINGGQNVKSEKPKVAYHYAVYRKPPTKIDDGKVERLPAVGEVIQDRFNARPYFGYGKIPPKSQESATYAPPKPSPAAAPAPPPPSFDSFPAVFNVAPSSEKSVDLYTSPYSSYNPPPQKPNNSPVSDSYPPSLQDSYAAPVPTDDQDTYSYTPPKPPVQPPTPSYASLGPPLSPSYTAPQSDDNMDMNQDQDMHSVDAPPSDHMPRYHDHGPPDYPPKSEDDIYYPPDDDSSGGHGMVLDHPPKDYKPPAMSMNQSPPADMGMGMAMDMSPPADMGMGMPMDMSPPADMTMDLSPPPSDDHMPAFPQYLYDGHHFDHHVYEEVPHTTTEAMEDKRVSSGHYSYYYLGRKLWYVPLYFSIYFIIYVAVLILKSIARHKVQYKHKFLSSSKNARSMGSDQDYAIDDLHRNVTHAISRARKYYTTFGM